MVDATALLEGLQENKTLVELDLSNNQITDRKALGSALAHVLKVGSTLLVPGPVSLKFPIGWFSKAGLHE